LADPHEVLRVAASAGELLLRCGADVARVEDTVARIARAYGISDVEIYATPTGLFISLGGDTHVTVVKRVARRIVALDRVSAVNGLSRQIASRHLEPGEALARIRAIEVQPGPVPTWTEPLFRAVSAAACTMLVGGVPREFGAALLANIVVQGVGRLTRTFRLPEALGEYLAGAVAVGCALLLNRWVGARMAPVVAGGIMVLLPGTAFTAAIRDAMAGDLVSSGARALEAAMQAAALASGVATALYMVGGMELL
jgi:uncharacterized membrane protein YjjP (DUF1212 family)